MTTNQQKGDGMNDKVRLTYKNRRLKIMMGRKELPLNKISDPATIVLSAGELPTLSFELLIDDMEIDDVNAFGKWVSKEQLIAQDSLGYVKGELNDGVNGGQL